MLYLPRLNEAEATDRADARRPKCTEAGRDETVLLVEDGEELLSLYARQLRFLGYRVLSAADAQAALAVAEQAERVDVLLTDAILAGGTNGYELAQKVVASRPDVRVRFMTGHADTVFADADRTGTAVSILRKPFSLSELSTHVAAAQKEGAPA